MRTCDGCILEDVDDSETCEECSRIDGDRECSCHVNPPCSFCVEDKYEEKSKPTIDLSDIDGNAFIILGTVKKAMKKMKLPKEYIDKYYKEATAGDYDHLLQVTMEYCEVE